MQRVILVVSPDTEFLQQLRSHLEEGGRYQVTVALSAHEALNLANSNFFEIAILDGELDDIPVAAFSRDLAALQSELKILVFPPDNNPQHPVLEGLVANGFLSKPFSGQEIGKALSSLYSDQPVAGNTQVKVVDDLVKQWLQIPETGGQKAEHILKATTAQTVLIIIKDQLIASAGSKDESTVTNVTGFLSRYWKDEENNELARYLRLDSENSERFLYATKLVSNVVLVLIYPMNTTIQLVRRELNFVKVDFQQHYPTIGELRQDIAKQTLADINVRNKKLENQMPVSSAVSQNELDMLNLMEQSRQKPTSSTISQAEVDLLKVLNQESQTTHSETVSQIELEARKLFEQESLKTKSTGGLISQAEIDALKALHKEHPKAAVSQAESEARRLFEQESIKPKPGIEAFSQAEIDALKAMEEEPPKIEINSIAQVQGEGDGRRLFEQESLKPVATSNGVSQTELDALKLFQQESLKPVNVVTPSISEQELSELSKLLNQMPAPDPLSDIEPVNNPQTQLSETKLPEWLNELDNTEAPVQPASVTQSTDDAISTGTPPFVVIDENMTIPPIPASTSTPEPLPEIDFKLPWEIEESTPQTISTILANQPVEPATESVPDPVAEPIPGPIAEQNPAAFEPPVEILVEEQPPALTSFAEVLSAVTPQTEISPEPPLVESAESNLIEPTESEPPLLKDFRFKYTCVLIPGDHNQFLARNLSERIGGIMPEIHEDQGWHMTSITIRPQYLLWTVAVPMGICPHRILQEVRNLTSNSIFANFPEIAKVKTSNDFWSSKFLIVSGSEPPPVNLIFDFVNNAWKNSETDTP